MNIILLGAPGAGKGTQGSRLADRLGIPKVATGDILRAAVRDGTELGREAKSFMDAGELVPDTVILGLVREALADESAREGVILDGFPRNVAQAISLDQILDAAGRHLDAIVVIDVPEEAIVQRMSGRRSDPETGQVYHLLHNPPPPGVSERLVQRPDDREETVRHRLEVHAEQTAPLIEYYAKSEVPVFHVDGTRPIDQVQADILSRLAL